MTRQMMTVQVEVLDYEAFFIAACKMGVPPEELMQEALKKIMRAPAKFLCIHH